MTKQAVDRPDGFLNSIYVRVVTKNMYDAVAGDLPPANLQFKRLYRADL
jgi:hypothetical protein